MKLEKALERRIKELEHKTEWLRTKLTTEETIPELHITLGTAQFVISQLKELLKDLEK